MKDWYVIDNVAEVDSPGLLLYPDRIIENIRIFKSFSNDPSSLRPHVKTNKSAETCKLLIKEGIHKFKCSTIAEAEMLAMVGAADVLLAHQPVGPKGQRLANLIKKYPNTKFSCLVDDAANAQALSATFGKNNLTADVFLDLNVGMNRTGIEPEKALELFKVCNSLKGIRVIGLHAYDGHLRDPELSVRKKQCDEGFDRVMKLKDAIASIDSRKLVIVAGGTPSFPIHAKRAGVEASPGTFIYWDRGYQQLLSEQPFLFSALVITRVISIPTSTTICVDLGHKAIASENPLDKRVYFLNAEGLTPIGHSEEHLVLQTAAPHSFKVGDVLYGVPHHICPTVALHDMANIVENGKFTTTWETLSRKRKINI